MQKYWRYWRGFKIILRYTIPANGCITRHKKNYAKPGVRSGLWPFPNSKSTAQRTTDNRIMAGDPGVYAKILTLPTRIKYFQKNYDSHTRARLYSAAQKITRNRTSGPDCDRFPIRSRPRRTTEQWFTRSHRPCDPCVLTRSVRTRPT